LDKQDIEEFKKNGPSIFSKLEVDSLD